MVNFNSPFPIVSLVALYEVTVSSKNIQAAGSATAAGAASADAIKTAATTASDREFTRAYKSLSRRNRRVVEYLILGAAAKSERRPIAALAYWAAACATNPPAALRMLPYMRRLWQVVAVCVCACVLLSLATACSGSNAGNDSSALRAKYGQPAQSEAQAGAPATDQPTPTPQISATDTPDAQPLRVEVTRIIEATRIVEVVVTATPDITGFQNSGIDESAQPCPVKYWKRGRCIANDATVEAYANEVQP